MHSSIQFIINILHSIGLIFQPFQNKSFTLLPPLITSQIQNLTLLLSNPLRLPLPSPFCHLFSRLLHLRSIFKKLNIPSTTCPSIFILPCPLGIDLRSRPSTPLHGLVIRPDYRCLDTSPLPHPHLFCLHIRPSSLLLPLLSCRVSHFSSDCS